VMAKSLVRNRHAVTKMYQLKSQLQAVSLRIAVRALPHFAVRRHSAVSQCWPSARRPSQLSLRLPGNATCCFHRDCAHRWHRWPLP